MTLSRRDFLKTAGLSLGAAAVPLTTAEARAPAAVAENSASMLYDSTMCVGCRACQTACKVRAGLPHEVDPSGLYEMPHDLTSKTWTIIKLYKDENEQSFVKNQCMHCIEPACVSVCPVGALEKLESGPVIYHRERCIGCRYCMAACPFGIPKTEWEKPLPYIQKCDFCAERQSNGEEPACSAACPTGALIYGSRKAMLDIAKTRLAEDPKYVPHIYGEREAGGTSMLYISHVDFQKLGFPEQSDLALPEITWPYMKGVLGVIGVMVTLSTAVYFRTHRGEENGNGNGNNHGKEA
jgi:formate dehydrogenase beta subunit